MDPFLGIWSRSANKLFRIEVTSESCLEINLQFASSAALLRRQWTNDVGVVKANDVVVSTSNALMVLKHPCPPPPPPPPEPSRSAFDKNIQKTETATNNGSFWNWTCRQKTLNLSLKSQITKIWNLKLEAAWVWPKFDNREINWTVHLRDC